MSGPDGSGKTSILNKLKDKLSNNNSVKIEWLRFQHFTAKVINGLGRLLGLSYREKYDWGRIGYHNYGGLIGKIYIRSVYFDNYVFRNQNNKTIFNSNSEIVLVDRYIVDIMADLIVDTKRHDLVDYFFGDILVDFNKKCMVFVLVCDYSIVKKRRPDIALDKCYLKRIAAYNY